MAILRDSGTRHYFVRFLHQRRVTGPLGEAGVAVHLSDLICRNPFQRAECSNGQMKTDTLDAVGLRNAYGAYSRG